MIVVSRIGDRFLLYISGLGRFTLFLGQVMSSSLKPFRRPGVLINSLDSIGFGSIIIIILTSSAIGLVMGLQGYLTLEPFGITYISGGMVAIAVTRELGPILTGLMVAARSGSSMSAEIASMKVGEQLDALRAMAVNPYEYVIAPRVIATTLAMPILMSISLAVSLLSSYVLVVVVLGVNDYMYRQYTDLMLMFPDYLKGMLKAAIFGFILSSISCYQGYNARPDATGVGIATTNAVVWSSVMILLADSVLTLILF